MAHPLFLLAVVAASPLGAPPRRRPHPGAPRVRDGRLERDWAGDRAPGRAGGRPPRLHPRPRPRPAGGRPRGDPPCGAGRGGGRGVQRRRQGRGRRAAGAGGGGARRRAGVQQGVFIPKEIDVQDTAEVKFTLDVNLMGNFHVIKAALPAMRRRDGRPRAICLISSQAGQVGIYGYTAYCASKFALRGLGEALQQEVIADDIHVSIVYPPDTDTPGLQEELKTRPELTDALSNSSGRVTADAVAGKALGGIRAGAFHVACNVEGVMLALASTGMSPQRSPAMALLEVAAAGLMRLVALSILRGWYGVIQKHGRSQQKKKKTI